MDANSNPSCFETCNETEIMDALAFGVMPTSQSILGGLSPCLFRFLATIIEAERQTHRTKVGLVTPPSSPRTTIIVPNAPHMTRVLLESTHLANSRAVRSLTFLQVPVAAPP